MAKSDVFPKTNTYIYHSDVTIFVCIHLLCMFTATEQSKDNFKK